MTTIKALNLRDDIAACLQARLSWPQADACADDVVNMFERRLRSYALTCQHCRNSAATHLLVADLSPGRTTHLVCEPCGQRGVTDAGGIARSASSVWLFALAPARSKPAVRRDDRTPAAKEER